MRRPWIPIFAALALLTSGCNQAPEATPKTEAQNAVAVEPAKATPAPKAAEAKPAPKPAPKPAVTKAVAKPKPKPVAKRPGSKVVAWDAPLEWLDWDAGLAKAKAEKKPIMLLVFADW